MHRLARRVVNMALILTGALAASPATPSAPGAELFTEGSKLRTNEEQAIRAAVCGSPTAIITSKKTGYTGCEVCPSHKGVGSPGQRSTKAGEPAAIIRRIYGGSFTAVGARDAVAVVIGCEANTANFGGLAVLQEQGGGWTLRRYEPGHRPESCLRFDQSSPRLTVLACHDRYGAQGIAGDKVYTVAIGAAKTTITPVFAVESNRGSCQRPTVDAIEMLRWTRRDTNGDGRPDLAIQVTENRRVRLPTECTKPVLSSDPRIHNVYFRWDGKGFAPAPISTAIARCLDNTRPDTTAVPGQFCAGGRGSGSGTTDAVPPTPTRV